MGWLGLAWLRPVYCSFHFHNVQTKLIDACVKYERVGISIFFVVPAVLLQINQNLKPMLTT